VVPLVADLVVKPSFPADELTGQTELQRRNGGPPLDVERRGADLFVVVAGVTPVLIVATPQMLDAVTVDQIAAWHRAR
jgi:hypothetical protein